MIYLLGSSGYLGKKIIKLFNNKLIIGITSKKKNKKKNIIQTKIFKKFEYRHEKWVNKITDNDTLIILSNPGSLKFYENNKKKVTIFETLLETRLLKKIKKNIRIIFLSSDMVFFGGKNSYLDNSKKKPINEYGKSKNRIENKIKKLFSNSVILRLPKIYSKNLLDNTIYKQVIDNYRKKKISKLFNNQKMHYMNLQDLLAILKKIIKNKKIIGSFNLSTKTLNTRYNLAKKFLVSKNLPINFLQPISYKDINIMLPKKIKMQTKLYKRIDYTPKF
jgi:dTDP-4-dehydrorhamnose reductase